MRRGPVKDGWPFEIAGARIKRADIHRIAVGEIWDQFLNEAPYRSYATVDADGNGELRVEVDPERLPLDAGFEFGEMLYQLRAALDSCIYDAAIHQSGQDPPTDERSLEFPICDSLATFVSSNMKIKALGPEYGEFIEAVQPYNAPDLSDELKGHNINLNLAILNDWARKDRHRSLHITRSRTSRRNPQLVLPEGVILESITVSPDSFLEHDSLIATFKLRGWHQEMEIEANPNMLIDIGIDEPPPSRNDDDTLGQRAAQLMTSVDSVVAHFEAISRK